MKTKVTWRRNCAGTGWHLLNSSGEHLGTVLADGSWYCVTPDTGGNVGSQPLAAQALLNAAGVERW